MFKKGKFNTRYLYNSAGLINNDHNSVWEFLDDIYEFYYNKKKFYDIDEVKSNKRKIGKSNSMTSMENCLVNSKTNETKSSQMDNRQIYLDKMQSLTEGKRRSNSPTLNVTYNTNILSSQNNKSK